MQNSVFLTDAIDPVPECESDGERREGIGDWMVALEPRAVVYFYQREGQQVVEMIYDKHTQKHGERSDVPLPETMEYVFRSRNTMSEAEKLFNR
jgi:hypothetical protein